MKLGIQGWFLAQPHTGIGKHCLGLLREIARRPNVQAVIPVPMPMNHIGIPKHWIKVIRPKWWLFHASLKKWYWERYQVPRFFSKQRLQWELYPYPCPLPEHSSSLRAMTVHDTILWTDKRYMKGFLKSNYHRASKHTLVNMDKLFCVSDATRKDLNIPSAILLPNAVEIPKELNNTDHKKDLVYLGGYALHKQVPSLIKAFSFVRKNQPETGLILLGEAHHRSIYYPQVPDCEGVTRMGTLTDRQIYSILSSAFALVHFSDSEGFNMPLLQAMSVGCPVIARDLPVNCEVSHGKALLLKNPDGPSLLKAIKYIRRHREDIIQSQFKAAGNYSWKKSVNILLENLR